MDVLDLSGRVAIVTGGGTGIGAATAELLAAHGADVASCGEVELGRDHGGTWGCARPSDTQPS